jgi:hypothetical protein
MLGRLMAQNPYFPTWMHVAAYLDQHRKGEFEAALDHANRFNIPSLARDPIVRAAARAPTSHFNPWIVDFACPEQMLGVEIDGGDHDNVVEHDLKRQQHLDSMGWKVIRVCDQDVEEDAEAVARAFTRELNLTYEFSPRQATGSGMSSLNATKKT